MGDTQKSNPRKNKKETDEEKMKERKKYRPFMVVYDGNRQTNWMTQGEMEEQVVRGTVNRIGNKRTLSEFEIEVYQTKLLLEEQKTDESYIAGNRVIADRLSRFAAEPISRKTVKGARVSIARKLGFKGGW